MLRIIFLVCGILTGSLISHYTAYIINKSEDCEKPFEHKILSGRNFIICILNGILWMLVSMCYGQSYLCLVYLVATSMLLSISVVDFAIYEIPPQFNVIIALMGLINLFTDLDNWLLYVIGIFVVSGLFWLIIKITKGKGMGGGDVRLMAAAGFLLGWQKILVAMFLGSIIGSVIHGLRMIISKKDSVLAFGPYLAAGIFIMMCYGTELIQWYILKFLTFE